jgi:serine O-acetyltransferase
MQKRDLYTRLLYGRQLPIIGKLAYFLLKAKGVEVPLSVKLGSDCLLVHGAFGSVIHPKTTIGSRVKIYPGVTLGRADIYRPIEESQFEGIVIEDDVILSPGAKVLCQEGILYIRKRAVIGANAVVLQSVGEAEIWAGIPAKQIGVRTKEKSIA